MNGPLKLVGLWVTPSPVLPTRWGRVRCGMPCLPQELDLILIHQPGADRGIYVARREDEQ